MENIRIQSTVRPEITFSSFNDWSKYIHQQIKKRTHGILQLENIRKQN